MIDEFISPRGKEMNRLTALVGICGLAILSGCGSKGDLSRSSTTRTESFPQNYQALHRTILNQMEKCFHTGAMMIMSPVRNEISSQIYSDLGETELAYFQSNISNIYYHVVKIKRTETGSTMTVSTGNKLEVHNRSELELYFKWARGSTACE
jgi:hypothetical protein